MDVASAAELYARKAKLGKDAVNYAVGIKLDAERMLGVYLEPQATPDAPHGGRPDLGSNSVPKSDVPSLAELGISKKLSAEAQRLVQIATLVARETPTWGPAITAADQDRRLVGGLRFSQNFSLRFPQTRPMMKPWK